MRRRLFLILVLLVAGAIVNVAVAYCDWYLTRFATTAEWVERPFMSGWPSASLEARYSRLAPDVDHIPMCPIWPGFAINTVFYALVLWPLFAGLFALRRRRRIRRGLCPACGYPVGASDVCTECGAAVMINSA